MRSYFAALVGAGGERPRVLALAVERLERRRDPGAARSPGAASSAARARARDDRIEAVLEQEQLEVAAGAVERAAGRRTGASRRRARPRRARRGAAAAIASRSVGGVGGGRASRRRRAGAPSASHSAIVRCSARIRPAASASRSPSRRAPAGASAASASGVGGARPCRGGAHRVAREPRLLRDRARGRPRTASTGAPSKTTRWLADARMPAPANQRVVDRRALREVDVGQAQRRSSPRPRRARARGAGRPRPSRRS